MREPGDLGKPIGIPTPRPIPENIRFDWVNQIRKNDVLPSGIEANSDADLDQVPASSPVFDSPDRRRKVPAQRRGTRWKLKSHITGNRLMTGAEMAKNFRNAVFAALQYFR